MKPESVHTEEYHGFTINIYPDDNPESPREWSNLGTMVCFHRRYNLGDKHSYSIEEVKEIIKRDDVISLPIYMYDHSGIGLSTSNARYPFNCPWDSGQLGYIFVTYDKIKENFNRKRITRKIIERTCELLQSEVEIYNDYVSGNVYGYVIKDGEGKVVDSVWGYYGDPEKFAVLAAKESIDYYLGEQNFVGEKI